jgi:hypothetical protein
MGIVIKINKNRFKNNLGNSEITPGWNQTYFRMSGSNAQYSNDHCFAVEIKSTSTN